MGNILTFLHRGSLQVPGIPETISAKGLLVKLSSEKALQGAVSQAVGATWELATQ